MTSWNDTIAYGSHRQAVNRHCYGVKCVRCYKPDH
jgi:hypothetical protein